MRGLRVCVLACAQGAVMAYPENPRDAEDRVLCPICKRSIGESEPTSKGGCVRVPPRVLVAEDASP
jgi:hypothetical protein